MKRKMKPAAKIAIGILFVVIVLGGAYFGGFFTPGEKEVATSSSQTGTPAPTSVTQPAAQDAIDISLDEWVGWKSIIDANGGLTTKPGSIYDQLGLKVNINIIGDANQSSTAIIAGNLDGAGYTVNRYAFLYPRFKENNVPVKMVYITNYSSGGDGIITTADIKRFEDLVGKKIGVPRFSEAQTMVEFILKRANLTDAQRQQIRNDIVWFNDPGECGKALFSGQIQAAATWQPFISQAQSTAGFKVLFSTKDASNIILDGIVFRDDFAKANPDKIQKFIEGTLKAASMYSQDVASVKLMPTFSTMSDAEIRAMLADATLSDFTENTKQLGGTAQNLFTQMSFIWKDLGEAADPGAADMAFDKSYLSALTGKFQINTVAAPVFTQEQIQQVTAKSNDEALLTQRLTINFESGSAAISSDSLPAIVEFAKTAELLNRVAIQIEGNTDNVGSPESNRKLSLQRAESVKKYLISFGIDASRIVTVGNGPDKPIADNGSTLGKAQNRRTDIYFKTVQ